MSTEIRPLLHARSLARTADLVRTSHWVMALGVLLAFIAGYAFWDPIPSNGLGWDGAKFGRWVQSPSEVLSRGVSAYDAYRVLPSLSVSLGLTAAGLSRTVPRVVFGFSVLNTLLFVGAALLWWPISNSLRLSLRARWLGFIGIFVNYAALRQPFWMPVLTDYVGFFVGMLVLYLFLARRSNLLMLVGCVGAFAWPAVGLSTALLLIVPRRDDTGLMPAEGASKFGTVLASAVAAGLTGLWAWLHFGRGITTVGLGPVVPTVQVLLWASVPLAAAYCFLGLRTLLAGVSVETIVRELRALQLANVLRALATVVVPTLVARALLIDPTAESLSSTGMFLTFLAMSPISRPLITPISHVVFYGPVVLIALFYWRSVVRASYGLGVGFVAFLSLQFMIALSSESRQALIMLPAVVAMVCVATERERWKPYFVWTTGAIALVGSKFWWNLVVPGDHVSRHFMSYGPYMRNRPYLVHFLVVTALAVFVWLNCRASPDRSKPSR